MNEKIENILNIGNRKLIEKGVNGPIEYEKYSFSGSYIKKLKDLNFPLDLTKETLIIEIHLKNVLASLGEYREAIQEISVGHNGYVIGLSWIAGALRRFGFTVEDISPEIVKEFPAGYLVQNQKRIAKEFLEKLERMSSRQNIEVEENGKKIHINTLNQKEEKEFENMQNTFIGYEALIVKKGGPIDLSDVKLAWLDKRS